ncbi:MAG: pseudouridine synthase [Candidatus Margulisiibacteriota bacterium]
MTFKAHSSLTPLIKYLRENSGASRRNLLKKIMNGHVQVNQAVIVDSQFLVSQSDLVILDGKRVQKEGYLYYKFHKPLDVISTFNDPKNRSDLSFFIKKNKLNPTLKPIGRLDRHSSGLLLFSNDGEFIQKILHPKYLIEKDYEIIIDSTIRKTDMDRMSGGFFLDDGPVKINFKQIFSETHFIVSISMGRNRILRRSFDFFGYKITKLHRRSIGSIELGNLKKGAFQKVSPQDVKTLVLN